MKLSTLTVLLMLVLLKTQSSRCECPLDDCELPSKGELCSGGKCRNNLTCMVMGGVWMCGCPLNTVFNQDSQQCELIPTYGKRCTTLCQGEQLSCLLGDGGFKICLCGSPNTQFYDVSSEQCLNKKKWNEECASNNECDGSLQCFNSKCSCDEANQFWDKLSCQKKGRFNEVCYSDFDSCLSSLSCIDDVCTCQEAQYYNGSICKSKKGISKICSSSKECVKTLTCRNSVCSCTEDEYFSNTHCAAKKPYSSVCQWNFECSGELQCLDSVCNCNDLFYYNDLDMCELRKSFDQPCELSTECKDTMSCLGGQCNCQPKLEYRSDLVCEPKKFFSQSCSQDDHCMETLSCRSDKCGCDVSLEYWNGNECQSRKTRGSGCFSIDNECRDPLMCTEDKKCDCEGTKYYHVGGDGSFCLDKRDKGQACLSTTQCKDSMICTDGKTCGCSNDSYYNGATCLPSKMKDDPCSSSPKVLNECMKGLECNNGKCDCPSDKYYTGSSCASKVVYNGICDKPIQCFNPYTCIVSRCQCSSLTYYNNGGCLPRKNITDFCSSVGQCLDSKLRDCTAPRVGTNQPMCLCKKDYYHNTIFGNCSLMTDLQVKSCFISNYTHNSISFVWSTTTYGKSVSYEMSSTAVGSFQAASQTGGQIFGLPSGSEYTYYVTSTLAQDKYYQQKKTKFTYGRAWTKPSKPGYLDLTRSQLKTNPMTFGFHPSDGKVYRYQVTLSLGPGSISKFTSIPEVRGLTLQQGQKYGYEIVALNENQDKSEETSKGTFVTDVDVSPPIEDLTIDSVTTKTASVQWRAPRQPKGNIHAFVLQLFLDNSCMQAHVLKCSNCQNDQVPTFPECTKTLTFKFTRADVESPNHVFTKGITSLVTYTRFVVKIFAITEAGNGIPTEKAFTSAESAPGSVLELDLTSSRESRYRRVNLVAAWTPGKETGVTSYEIKVIDKADGSDAYSVKQSGYTRTTYTFSNVLAYHEYTVSVVVETNAGRSKAKTKTVRTATTNPASIRSLVIIPDPIYATRMTVQMECPLESAWNGIIQGFSIVKTGVPEPYIVKAKAKDCKSVIKVDSRDLGDFVVGTRYQIQVRVKNQDYESQLALSQYFQPKTKAPVFDKNVLSKGSSTSATETTVTVSLCSTCLTDASQGRITNVGLIVCVKSFNNSCSTETNRKKRETFTEAKFKEYQTWARANKSDFLSPYRTTPNDWLRTLESDNPSSFVIGQVECSNDLTHFCNGPLPLNRDIIVTAIACTSVGCQDDSPLFISRSGGDGSDSSVKVVIIVAAIIAVIVILIIVGIGIFCYCRRKTPRRETSRLPAAVDLDPLRKKQSIVQENELKSLHNPSSRPIKMREFCERVAKMHKDTDLLFLKDFEALEKASLKFNRNRAYDNAKTGRKESLSVSTDDDATFIPGFNSKKEYIACVGPKPGKIAQFWKMVWDNKCDVIIMWSSTPDYQTRESDYWRQPNMKGATATFGDFTVKTVNKTNIDKCTIRDFILSMRKSERRVVHFCIHAWLQGGKALSPQDTVSVLQAMRERIAIGNERSIIVQFSDDAYMMGAVIAIDYFAQFVKTHTMNGTLDVFSYVLQMRQCGKHIVKDDTEYVFIFDALAVLIQKKIEGQENVYEQLDNPDYVNV